MAPQLMDDPGDSRFTETTVFYGRADYSKSTSHRVLPLTCGGRAGASLRARRRAPCRLDDEPHVGWLVCDTGVVWKRKSGLKPAQGLERRSPRTASAKETRA